MTLEGSQSQQLPGGINFSRLSPVELLGNLLGDKNRYICRGQAQNRGLHQPGQAGEGPAFKGSCGAAEALCRCPPGGRPGSSCSPRPRRSGRGEPQAARAAAAPGVVPACQAVPVAHPRARGPPLDAPWGGVCSGWGTRSWERGTEGAPRAARRCPGRAAAIPPCSRALPHPPEQTSALVNEGTYGRLQNTVNNLALYFRKKK